MLLALSVPLAAPTASAAEGEITFCNEFAHKVYIAIAYLQTDYNNHLSRGWLNVETGKCYAFDTALRVETFYYHAESDPYKEGRDKVKMNWGKGTQFAVRDGNFQSYNAEKKYSGMHFVEFSKGPVSSGAPLTAIVTFLEDASVRMVVPAQPAAPIAPRRPRPPTMRAAPRPRPGNAPGQAEPPVSGASPN